MTQQQIILVQKTWKIFMGIRPEIVGDVFYSRLFSEMPALKKMFKNPMKGQYKKLVDMISLVVGRLENPDGVMEDINHLGRRHVEYGVKPYHYTLIGDALLWTLQQGLGKDWNREVNDAWRECYNILSSAMIDASSPVDKLGK